MAGQLYVQMQALTHPGWCLGLHVSLAIQRACQASPELVWPAYCESHLLGVVNSLSLNSSQADDSWRLCETGSVSSGQRPTLRAECKSRL